MAVTLNINNQQRTLDFDAYMPLLWAIRDVVGLTGTKFGCGLAQCGACTVYVDGEPTRSCQTPVSDAEGVSVLPSKEFPARLPKWFSRFGPILTCRNAGTASRAR